MKKLLFIILPLITFAQSKKEPYPFVSMDSLVSRAFRIHYVECEFMKKDLFDTRTLFQKQSEITDNLKKIIDLQNREAVLFADNIDILKDENKLIKNALNDSEKALAKEKRKKKLNKYIYFGIGCVSGFVTYKLLR
jgi:hypothetical protein